MKIDAAARSAVVANTRAYRGAGGATVPTTVFRHRRTGECSAIAGAMDCDTLKLALGIG